MLIKESNKERINQFIAESEGRARERKITYRDLEEAVKTVERKLNIPKKYMEGIEVDVDINAQTLSFETEIEINRIANILYNMSLDMDYADNAENAADEIDILTDQLKMIRDCGFDTLLNALDLITMLNIDQENRYF